MGARGFGSQTSARREALQTQLWPLPTLAVVLAFALGVALPRLDVEIAGALPPTLKAYLFGGGAGAARTVLDAIASSLITVTSLTFSLTVVTLQLASGQFSPRLLRTFTRDRVVHLTLGLFLATFTYALTVLRTVRTANNDQQQFVPQVSVTVAFALALASVLGLVLFLAHLAQEIRVETMLRNVHEEASETVRRVLPGLDPTAEGGAALPVPPRSAVPLPAGSSGFLTRMDEQALVAAAADADAVVLLDRVPGDSLIAGTPVGAAWPRDAGSFDPDTWSRLAQRVAEAISTGFERTAAQDVSYGLRQLTDVAIRALSPGINDPTTAVHALSHSSALLCELACRDLAPRLLRDEQGAVRVVLRGPDLADLLELAMTQPRRYGAGDPFVLARLSSLLGELAWCVKLPDQRREIAGQLARLRDTTAGQDFDVRERTRLAGLAEQVQHALDGRWIPEGRTS
ncbi:MAG TPA: DUF2254 domain-containing protein [Pseudonocardiaceae bacterium]|nr:DUF2254 domain-containing protein [Pseudonocardiaceae bacterium]